MKNISKNLDDIRSRIKRAALKSGRKADSVLLCAVTKYRSKEEILELVDRGIHVVGENRVQELQEKYDYLNDHFSIHLIGHLQSKKTKLVVPLVSMIHSVDSFKLAKEINRICELSNTSMNILIQVNTSKEDAKFGVNPTNLLTLLREVSTLKNVSVKGLMTMAMFTDNLEEARECFIMLRKLKETAIQENIENISLEHLSMGMTNDFEIAIEEGATIVRIGSAIFS